MCATGQFVKDTCTCAAQESRSYSCSYLVIMLLSHVLLQVITIIIIIIIIMITTCHTQRVRHYPPDMRRCLFHPRRRSARLQTSSWCWWWWRWWWWWWWQCHYQSHLPPVGSQFWGHSFIADGIIHHSELQLCGVYSIKLFKINPMTVLSLQTEVNSKVFLNLNRQERNKTCDETNLVIFLPELHPQWSYPTCIVVKLMINWWKRFIKRGRSVLKLPILLT